MQTLFRIIKYKEEFDEQIENLDQLMYWKIKFHPDLIRESVYLVIEEKKVVGVAYLVKRSGFLHIDKELAYHEIILEHYIDSEALNQDEIMILLLEQMKKECDRISAEYPGKRIFIKCWEPEEEHGKIEMYLKNGFYIGRGTPVLVKKLDTVKAFDFTKPQYLNIQTDYGNETSLTVYQDNLPAIYLYEKMGYRYEKFNFGIQYETGYKAVEY